MSKPADLNLWQKTAPPEVARAPLSRNIAVDLLVIGGGFTGCVAALAATEKGASVALLEAQTIGYGGSGRNVGLVNAGLWLPPNEIIEKIGEKQARVLIERLSEAPSKVFDLIETHGIACEANRSGTLHLAHAASGLGSLENRFRQGNALGAPLALLDKEETARRTGSNAFHGALFDPRAGTIQPLSYCRGLAQAAENAGAFIAERSPVTSFEYDGRWVASAHGHQVQAKHLLLATNAYHQGLSPKPAFTKVFYSQFATKPLPPALRSSLLPNGEGCWDTATVMSSFRCDSSGRLIFGGMGNATGYGRAVHTGWARRALARVFPQLSEIGFEMVWSGSIAMTHDHIPKIMEIGPNALAVFGYSGRGIAPGTVFGAAAAEALLCGTHDGLPLSVSKVHKERFSRTKESFYEIGALVHHAIAPVQSPRPHPSSGKPPLLPPKN